MRDRIFTFLVRRRAWMVALTAVVALASAAVLPYVRINSDITTYLPADSPMRRGLSLVAQHLPGLDIRRQTLRLVFHAEPPSDTLQTAIEQVLAGENLSFRAETVRSESRNLFPMAYYQYSLPRETDGAMLKERLRERFGDRLLVEIEDNTGMPEHVPRMIAIGFALIFLILLVMCPSYIEALLFMLTIGVAILINMGTNILLRDVSMITNALSTVLQMALSLDYAIILSNRYRQLRGAGVCYSQPDSSRYSQPDSSRHSRPDRESSASMAEALRRATPSILSSALTTIASLLMLCFMRLRFGMDFGIVLSKGVLCSLLCTFTLLPGLLMRCDRGDTATGRRGAFWTTAHRVPLIPTDGLAKVEYRLRIPIAITLLALVIGAFFLQRRVPIYYAMTRETDITRAFPSKNQMLVVYPTAEEEAFRSIADALPPGVECLSYPTIALTPRSAAQWRAAYPDMLAAVPPEALDLLFYAASHPDRIERFPLSALRFPPGFERPVLPGFGRPVSSGDGATVSSGDGTTVSSGDASQAPSGDARLPGVERPSGDATLLPSGDASQAPSGFERPAPSGNSSSTAPSGIERPSGDATLPGVERPSGDAALLPFGDASQAPSGDATLLPSGGPTSPREAEAPSGIERPSGDATLLPFGDASQAPSPVTPGSTASTTSNSTTSTATSHTSMPLNGTVADTLSPLPATSSPSLATPGSTTSATQNQLPAESSSMGSSTPRFTYEGLNEQRSIADMSEYVGVEQRYLRIIYRLAYPAKLPSQVTMSAAEVMDVVSKRILGNKLYAGLIPKPKAVQLQELKQTFATVLAAGPTPPAASTTTDPAPTVVPATAAPAGAPATNTAGAPADITSPAVSTTTDPAATTSTTTTTSIPARDTEISPRGPEGLGRDDNEMALAANTATTTDTAGTPATDSTSAIPRREDSDEGQFEELALLALSGKACSAEECFGALHRAGMPVKRDEVDMLYLYNGYLTAADPTTRLSLVEMLSCLDTLVANPLAAAVIDSTRRAELDVLRTNLTSQLSLLRSDTWSAAVLMSDLPEEGPETYAFIAELRERCEAAFLGETYLAGYSVMYDEMKDTFPKELLLVTLLTALVIFTIVALTFRSLLIPFILVAIVLTAVWLDVFFSGIGGHPVLFMAYFIVQSILMGATIDYSILFTHYYRESRHPLPAPDANSQPGIDASLQPGPDASLRPGIDASSQLAFDASPQPALDALRKAYRGSIHTIMTSGMIITLGTWAMTLVISDPVIVPVLRSIASGSLIAILLILLALPGLLTLLNRPGNLTPLDRPGNLTPLDRPGFLTRLNRRK